MGLSKEHSDNRHTSNGTHESPRQNVEPIASNWFLLSLWHPSVWSRCAAHLGCRPYLSLGAAELRLLRAVTTFRSQSAPFEGFGGRSFSGYVLSESGPQFLLFKVQQPEFLLFKGVENSPETISQVPNHECFKLHRHSRVMYLSSHKPDGLQAVGVLAQAPAPVGKSFGKAALSDGRNPVLALKEEAT